MAKKNKNEDQDFSEINLLPEDLRSAEKKARKASSTKEELYQLRAPKKIKRRKRFGLIPFFGGPHWEVKGGKDKKMEKEEKKDPSTVIRQTSDSPTSREQAQPLRPSVSPETIQVYPSAASGVPKMSRKKPVSFFGKLFGKRRKKASPTPRPQPRPSSSFNAPARHYSLLDEHPLANEEQEKKSTVPEPIPKSSDPGDIPMAATTGGLSTMPDRGMEDKASGEKVKGQHSVKWFDIFGLFKWLMTPSGPKRKKVRKSQEKPTEPLIIPAAELSEKKDSREAQSSSSDASTPKTVIPSVESAPRITPVVPEQQAQKKEKKQRSLPAWFDLFGIFGLLFKNSKAKPKKKKAPESVPAPEPVKMTPEAPITPKPDIPEAPKTIIPDQPVSAPTITPIAQDQPNKGAQKKEKKHRTLPAWLDLFSWFGSLFKHKKKKPKKSKDSKIPVPSSPEPVVKTEVEPETPQVKTPTQAGHEEGAELITPVSDLSATDNQRPGEVQKPETPRPETPYVVGKHDDDIMPIEPVMQEQASVDGVVPPKPESAPEHSETPSVPSPNKKEDHMIPAIPPDDSGEKTKRKKEKHAKGGLHMPGKGLFGNAPDASTVNLIPARYSVVRSWKQISQAISIAAGTAAIICGIAYVGLSVWQTQIEQRTSAIDSEIAAFTDQLRVYEDISEPEMTALGNKIDLVNALLARHIYWTDFFQLLEKYTLPDVYFDGISATTNGTLSLSAHGSSYETISRQLLLLQSEDAQEFASSVQINGGQLSGTSEDGVEVSFTVLLTLNPSLFYYGDSE